MKKIKFEVLIVGIMIGMSSCQKAETKIVGKWQVTFEQFDNKIDPESVGAIWQFLDEGTFYGQRVIGGEYLSCRYILNKKRLMLNGGDLANVYEAFDLEITKLNNKEMSLSGYWIDTWGEYEYGAGYQYIPIVIELRKMR